MVRLGSHRVMQIMADATNTIAEGEVLQLMNAGDPDTTEQRYLEVIYRKTAKLFEAGAQIAGVLAGANPAVEQAHIGLDEGRHALELGRRHPGAVGGDHQLLGAEHDMKSKPDETPPGQCICQDRLHRGGL
jgi:hypothetical protein